MSRSRIVLVTSAAVFALVLILGTAACGTIDKPPGGDGSSSTSTSTPGSSSTTTPTSTPDSTTTTLPAGSITHPTGSADVVLRVSTGGGFVPIEYNYTMTPEFTLYGDGRVIVTGPITAQYPARRCRTSRRR